MADFDSLTADKRFEKLLLDLGRDGALVFKPESPYEGTEGRLTLTVLPLNRSEVVPTILSCHLFVF